MVVCSLPFLVWCWLALLPYGLDGMVPEHGRNRVIIRERGLVLKVIRERNSVTD